MKKIMFNDRYGLTEAVLSGRKTQTRRICKEQHWSFSDIVNANQNDSFLFEQPKYRIGEVVAVAQKYSDVAQGGNPVDSRYDAFRTANWGDGEDGVLKSSAGWNNKLFTRADLMPHHIRITNVRVERLQDISDEDCIAEGVHKWTKDEELFKYDLADGFEMFEWRDKPRTPREAYAALIDRISGKGTWDSNPYVFVYDFELVK